MLDAVMEPLAASDPLKASQEVLVILLTRCGCTRVLGPAPADKLPEVIEVRLLTAPGALIEAGKEEGEARRFRLTTYGGDMLEKLGMQFGGGLPVVVYIESLTYGARKATVVRGVRVPNDVAFG